LTSKFLERNFAKENGSNDPEIRWGTREDHYS